jgi:hypothetical protein
MDLRRPWSSRRDVRVAIVAAAAVLLVVAWFFAWLLLAAALLAALGFAVVRTGLFDEVRSSTTELDDWQ